MYKIYMHTLNGKSYIGQTCKSLKARIGFNFQGYKECPLFYSAIKKYETKNIKTDILQKCQTIEEANRLESLYIFRYNTLAPFGYNLHTGGLNHTVSEITRQRISISKKGRKVSNKTREKMSIASHRRITPEFREKISKRQLGNKNHNFGKTTPKDVKQKLSIALSGEKNPAFRGDIDRASICKRYLAGETARNIAKSIKIGPTTVYRILRKSKTLRSLSEAQKLKKPKSIKTRKKMSITMKGKNNHFYGKTHTLKSRRKISEARNKKVINPQQLTLF